MLLGCRFATGQNWKPEIPRTWDEAALADWATPVAELNVRPTHISAKEYYSLITNRNLKIEFGVGRIVIYAAQVPF